MGICRLLGTRQLTLDVHLAGLERHQNLASSSPSLLASVRYLQDHVWHISPDIPCQNAHSVFASGMKGLLQAYPGMIATNCDMHRQRLDEHRCISSDPTSGWCPGFEAGSCQRTDLRRSNNTRISYRANVATRCVSIILSKVKATHIPPQEIEKRWCRSRCRES